MLKGSVDIIYARKTVKYLLMMYGIPASTIEEMDEDEVIELTTFIEKVEESRTKKLAHEIASMMWGKKKK